MDNEKIDFSTFLDVPSVRKVRSYILSLENEVETLVLADAAYAAAYAADVTVKSKVQRYILSLLKGASHD